MGQHGDVTDAVLVGTVRVLRRFPVKSTGGEQLLRAVVTERGLLHDREWAAYTADGRIASGKTTRRFRAVQGLLRWRSTVAADGVPRLHEPAGGTYRVDDPSAARALSGALRQPLVLRRETTARHHDECAVHLLTTSSVRAAEQAAGGPVDDRRLRANVVLETDGVGFVEDGWTGGLLSLGPEVVLRLGLGTPRCVMVDQPQVGVPDGPPVLRALGRTHGVRLGLQTEVVRPGTVSTGDAARLSVTERRARPPERLRR